MDGPYRTRVEPLPTKPRRAWLLHIMCVAVAVSSWATAAIAWSLTRNGFTWHVFACTWAHAIAIHAGMKWAWRQGRRDERDGVESANET